TGLKIKIGLRALLLCLEQFRLGGKPVIEPGLCRLLHGFRCFQCALSYHYLLSRSAQLVKAVGHIKDNFLMRAVETDIRHHQFLPRRCSDRIASAEVEQQPLRGQLAASQQRFGDQITAADNFDVRKIPIRWRRLWRGAQGWGRNEGTIVSPCCSRYDIGIICTRGQTDGGCCLTGALPCHTGFWGTPLCDVNQLGEIVRLARIDGRQIVPFSFSRLVLAKFSLVSWKRRWRPRSHRRRRSIIAAKCDCNRDEKLRRSNKSDLHKNLPIFAKP